MGEKIKRGTKRWGAAVIVMGMYVWLAVGPMCSQWIDSLGEGGFRAVPIEKWVKFFIDTSLVAFVSIRAFQSKRWHDSGDKASAPAQGARMHVDLTGELNDASPTPTPK